MAGNHTNTVALDPALVKYANMWKTRHQYFKWTPRTAMISFMYMVAVPGAFIYMAYTTDGKYEMRGKRRGDIVSEF